MKTFNPNSEEGRRVEKLDPLVAKVICELPQDYLRSPIMIKTSKKLHARILAKISALSRKIR